VNTPIADREVHLWQFSLRGDPARTEAFFDLLNEDERARAARFHFAEDRARFVMARGSLRRLLAGYLRQPPESIRFHYGPQGKPELAANDLEPRLSFNLSHSHEVGFCAVARGRQVGADVEKIRPEAVDSIGTAEHFFTPGETQLIRSAPPETQAETFFRLWTRKEAYLKGHGKGLSMPLNEFEVSLEHPGIRLVQPGGNQSVKWFLHEFRPCPEYVAAVAVEGEHREVEFRRMVEPEAGV
jgi:4'-phosphopantetheinyl transferase